jgi:hypothetical protein
VADFYPPIEIYDQRLVESEIEMENGFSKIKELQTKSAAALVQIISSSYVSWDRKRGSKPGAESMFRKISHLFADKPSFYRPIVIDSKAMYWWYRHANDFKFKVSMPPNFMLISGKALLSEDNALLRSFVTSLTTEFKHASASKPAHLSSPAPAHLSPPASNLIQRVDISANEKLATGLDSVATSRSHKKIFISYRRDDSRWQARQIFNAIAATVPRESVFMDIDAIPMGADFVDELERWVRECDILLALIGTGWLVATNPKTGMRRLDNELDFVRVEIREALARNIPVVPVLIDEALMPNADELPYDIKKLVRRQAEFLQFRTFDADVERLIRKLRLGQP